MNSQINIKVLILQHPTLQHRGMHAPVIYTYWHSHNWVDIDHSLVRGVRLKAPDHCTRIFDHECPIITDKLTEILDCIPNFMVILLHSASQALISTILQQAHSVPTMDLSQTQMDRCALPNVLSPSFMVDYNGKLCACIKKTLNGPLIGHSTLPYHQS